MRTKKRFRSAQNSSGGVFNEEEVRQLHSETRRVIEDAWLFSYFTRTMSYREAMSLTPYELNILFEKYANVLEMMKKK